MQPIVFCTVYGIRIISALHWNWKSSTVVAVIDDDIHFIFEKNGDISRHSPGIEHLLVFPFWYDLHTFIIFSTDPCQKAFQHTEKIPVGRLAMMLPKMLIIVQCPVTVSMKIKPAFSSYFFHFFFTSMFVLNENDNALGSFRSNKEIMDAKTKSGMLNLKCFHMKTHHSILLWQN